MMSYWIATAGFLSLVLTLVHVIGGGVDVHVPILQSGLSDVLKGYVSVIWHAITATMLMGSVLLLIAAWLPSLRRTLTLIVIIHYGLFTALFVFYGAIRFQSVFVMPPWIGFLIITLVALVGLCKENGIALRATYS